MTPFRNRADSGPRRAQRAAFHSAAPSRAPRAPRTRFRRHSALHPSAPRRVRASFFAPAWCEARRWRATGSDAVGAARRARSPHDPPAADGAARIATGSTHGRPAIASSSDLARAPAARTSSRLRTRPRGTEPASTAPEEEQIPPTFSTNYRRDQMKKSALATVAVLAISAATRRLPTLGRCADDAPARQPDHLQHRRGVATIAIAASRRRR